MQWFMKKQFYWLLNFIPLTSYSSWPTGRGHKFSISVWNLGSRITSALLSRGCIRLSRCQTGWWKFHQPCWGAAVSRGEAGRGQALQWAALCLLCSPPSWPFKPALLSAHLILNDENTDYCNLYVRLEVMQCALHLPFCCDLVVFQQYCPSGAPWKGPWSLFSLSVLADLVI